MATVDDFRKAAETHDVEAMMATLAPAVSFHSPIVFKTYTGRDEVRPILMGVMSLFEDFSYIGDYRSNDGAVLHFAARVGDRTLDGVDIIRFNGNGLISDFTVMVRPYSAATTLRERMAALLTSST